MANSRKSRPRNKALVAVTERFERALEAILARVVVSGDGALAVACSGGLDSVLLLRLAADHCRRTQRGLLAFHVHHGLSPNADAWLAHCEAAAAELGVGFDAAYVELGDRAGEGTEQAARTARYRALAELCRRHRVTLLLTAHHRDDQAETVLLQLLRGAGPRGLSAMADLQASHALLADGLLLGRPLLDCSRVELASAVATLGLRYVTDESNTDRRFRRNALRHDILPVIERHFPGSAAALARASRHWQSTQRLLDELAATDALRCAEGDALRIDCLQALSADRIDNLLRYWLAGQGASQLPSAAQLAQLRTQVLSAAADAHPLLAMAGMVLQRHGRLLVASPARTGMPPGHAIAIHWQGEPEIFVPAWRGTLLFEAGGGSGIDVNRLRQAPFRLVPRTGGERLKPDLRRPSRSLKNLYQEAAVPAQLRAWLPLAYLGEQLVFAAGLGIDSRAADSEAGVRLGWRSA